MAYASWSVVFGEQPSASKWNILGSNDADFNTRTTITRQDDTSNSDKTNPRTLTGWGYIAGTTSVSQVNETVTFGVTFAQRPIVTIACGGDSVAGTTYGSGGNNIEAGLQIKAESITTTNFGVRISKSGGNFGSNGNFFYQWIAIGEV